MVGWPSVILTPMGPSLNLTREGTSRPSLRSSLSLSLGTYHRQPCHCIVTYQECWLLSREWASSFAEYAQASLLLPASPMVLRNCMKLQSQTLIPHIVHQHALASPVASFLSPWLICLALCRMHACMRTLDVCLFCMHAAALNASLSLNGYMASTCRETDPLSLACCI